MIIDLGTKGAISLAVECFCLNCSELAFTDRETMADNLSMIVQNRDKQKYWIMKQFPDAKYIEEETLFPIQTNLT